MKCKSIAAVFLGALLSLAVVSTASAHHQLLTSSVERPCGAESSWSGTVTARVDADRDLTWRNRHSIAGGAFSALSPFVADEIPYVVTVSDIPAGAASVTVRVQSQWSNQAADDDTVTLNRPEATECPTTTTTQPEETSTTSPDTTTTLPTDTTTTSPATTATTPPPSSSPSSSSQPPSPSSSPSSSGPVVTDPPRLPPTGASTDMVVVAMTLIGLGAIAAGLTRRKNA